MIAGISIVLLGFVWSIAASPPTIAIGTVRKNRRALHANMPVTLDVGSPQSFRREMLRANEHLHAKAFQRQEECHADKDLLQDKQALVLTIPPIWIYMS
jgi:hypothetical protein